MNNFELESLGGGEQLGKSQQMILKTRGIYSRERLLGSNPSRYLWQAEQWPWKTSRFQPFGCVNVTLQGRRDFADVIKLRLLRWGEYPGSSGWALNVITKCPYGRDAEGDDTEEQKARWWCSRDWSDALWKWRKEPQAKEFRQKRAAEEGKEMDSPCKASRRMQDWQHLDFSPVKLILEFWRPELKENKLVLLSAPTFVVTCYSSHGNAYK